MSTIFSFFQANSSVCCSSALCEHDTLVSTSRRPSNAKSSLLKTQQRTLTMDFCPTISYLTRPSPELSPWLQLWETQLHCAQWDGAGEPTCMLCSYKRETFLSKHLNSIDCHTSSHILQRPDVLFSENFGSTLSPSAMKTQACMASPLSKSKLSWRRWSSRRLTS